MDKNALEELLSTAIRSGASSLHLIPGTAPCIRVQGKLLLSGNEPVSARQLEELTRDFLFADHRDQLRERGQVEILYSSRAGVRFRTSIMRQSEGLGILMRRVPTEIPKLEKLELPGLMGSFVQFRRGLVMLTGSNGSGKSTTMAAMVDKLNHESLCHIVTVEDPIEFVHQPAVALLHQREVGVHVGSTAQGIRQAMRVGADVVAVGRLSDFEGLDAALSAAEEGSLVLATFHASSVVAALSELTSLCPIEERARIRTRLAQALRVMVSQVLLQRVQHTGRVPVAEILLNNAAVRSAIRKGSFQGLHGIMEKCRGLGMQTLDLGLRNLLNRNLVSMDEALYYAVDREQVLPKLGSSVLRRS